MQHMAKSNKNQNGNSQVQSIIITAITLFALAGAILGFSVGALTHHPASHAQTANNKTTNTNKTAKSTPTIVENTPTPTMTAPVAAVALGGPAFTAGVSLAGTYKYTYTLQAMDKSNQPITTNGVTCRIWLAKAIGTIPNTTPDVEDSDKALFKNTAALQQALPNESAGLIFDSATPQTQPCVNGLGKWNVNLSPTIPKGNYYIVGLTENGTYINWSWSALLKLPLP